jgi:hypothetical protein
MCACTCFCGQSEVVIRMLPSYCSTTQKLHCTSMGGMTRALQMCAYGKITQARQSHACMGVVKKQHIDVILSVNIIMAIIIILYIYDMVTVSAGTICVPAYGITREVQMCALKKSR